MLSATFKDEYFGGGVVELFVVSEGQESQSSSTVGWRQLEDDIEFGGWTWL